MHTRTLIVSPPAAWGGPSGDHARPVAGL